MMRNDDKISAITLSTYNTTLQHGPSEGDSVWGPCDPRETVRLSGGAREGARACKSTKGLRFIKEKMQGVSPTHKTSLNLTSSTGGPVPVAT